MKTIRIPEGALDVTGPGVAPGTIDFKWFVRSVLNVDVRFNDTGPHIRTAVRIERAMEKALPPAGETQEAFFLEEADWALLRDAVEAPSGGEYPLKPARILSPYIEAIVEAK